MSSFGGKRKARKIHVNEDDEDGGTESPVSSEPKKTTQLKPSTTSHVRSKTFKKSSLRNSIAFDDGLAQGTASTDRTVDHKPIREVDFGTGRGGSVSSQTSTKQLGSIKKKPAASRLSFGPGEIISGDDAAALEDELFMPKKTTLRQGLEATTSRFTLPAYLRGREGEDEERPSYSKCYLEELKTSTPSTPKDLQGVSTEDGEEEDLDASELAGATVVESSGAMLSQQAENRAHIPTEAEIAEKKQRRARLAQEQDFISLDDGGDLSQIGQISLLPTRKKETRLVRDDEDVMEGFDDFVDDGRVSLGKKEQREAKRQQKKMIAQAILEAEGSSSEDSDDSEAERRAEYEAAQTRAGMDGLHKLDDAQAAALIPPKVTPIPSLAECLSRLRTSLSEAEQELTKRNWRMGELEREKSEIIVREQEVQRLLREAGERYTALRTDATLPPVDSSNPAAFVSVTSGFGETASRSRGLESFGNTPVGATSVEDVG